MTTTFNRPISIRSYALRLAALACLGWYPAAAQQKINYDMQVAPRYPAVAAMRSIGVLPFNGRDGASFTASLAGRLQSAVMDGRPTFDLRTMDSLNFRSTEVISKSEMATAIRNGQKLGVRVVFTGTVTEASVRQTPFTKEVTRCVGGGLGTKCNNVTSNVACQRVTGQYSVVPQAIRVDNGSILFSETVTRQGQYEQCADGGGAAIDFVGMIFGRKDATPRSTATTPEALLLELREDAAEVTKRLVSPYSMTVEVKIKNGTSGLVKTDNEVFKNAVEFAKGGRMDRACAMFDGLNSPANAQNVGLLYNLGVCQEVLLPDDPAAALAYYAKADGLLSKPDKLISEAYLRSKQLVANSRNVSRLESARK
ncbi:hypothetical protein [Sandarakinorhabdus sp.]|uniref:hypothetical protein n=1 Tax=Sandarakinorhabdus sp. TaxID=1916663 RepID=UPI003F6E99E2